MPTLALALALLWILNQRRLGSNIMDELKIHRRAPDFRGTVDTLMVHWRDVTDSLGNNLKTAAYIARAFRVSGLTQVFQDRGYCWRAVAAIMLHESGYGTSHAALQHDNLWGVSFQGPSGVWVPYVYDSMAHSVEHWLDVLSAARYRQARAVKDDGPAFLIALNKAGYNSTAAWLKGVLAAYGALSIV